MKSKRSTRHASLGKQPPPCVLHLNLVRHWFDQIAKGEKKMDYRNATPYWRRRLQGRSYDLIEFRNGYAKDALRMRLQFRGVRQDGRGANAQYAIRLGKILLRPMRRR
jgi:hypothetical protein